MKACDKEVLEQAVNRLEQEILESGSPTHLVDTIHPLASNPGQKFQALAQRASRTTIATIQNDPGGDLKGGLEAAHRLTLLVGIQLGIIYAEILRCRSVH